MPIRICQPIDSGDTPLVPGSSNILDVFLDLSKQIPGVGTLEDPYIWDDILNLIANEIDGGTKLTIWTLGSDHSLFVDHKRLLIEDRSFSRSVGQHITFISYMPCEWNIPFMSYGVSTLSTFPHITLKNVNGLTLKFSGFRIAPKYHSFIDVDNCVNCELDFIRNGIYPQGDCVESNVSSSSSSSSSGGDSGVRGNLASFMRVRDSAALDVNFILNTITDLSQSLSISNVSFIDERHSVFSDILKSGRFDVGNEFDNGAELDTARFSNTFNLFGNYDSFNNDWYPFFSTDNYRSILRKGWNRFSDTPVSQFYVVPYPETIAVDVDDGSVVAPQLIDEFDFEKDLRVLKTADILEDVNATLMQQYITGIELEEYNVDIIGHLRSGTLWDTGVYELDGEYTCPCDRYVDTFPVDMVHGNDGSTNVLLHLDQAPMLDRSLNRYLVVPNGIQIRDTYASIQHNWSMTVPCDVDLTAGVTAEFYFSYIKNADGIRKLGNIGYPVYVKVNGSTLTLEINGEDVIIGSPSIWYHITLGFLDDYYYVFVDGVLIAQLQFPTTITFNGEEIEFGDPSLQPYEGEIRIKEFRLSNVLRWDSTFTPIPIDTHYTDWGKVGSFPHPTSQYRMQHSLEQYVSNIHLTYNIWGDSEVNKEDRFLKTVGDFYIDGELTLKGFQNDGRELGSISVGRNNSPALSISLTEGSSLNIDRVTIMWDITRSGSVTLFGDGGEGGTYGMVNIVSNIIDVVGTNSNRRRYLDTAINYNIGGVTHQARDEHISYATSGPLIIFGSVVEIPSFLPPSNPFAGDDFFINLSGDGQAFFNNNVSSRSIEDFLTNDEPDTNTYKNSYSEKEIIDPVNYYPLQEEYTIQHHDHLVSLVDDAMEEMNVILRPALDWGIPFDLGTPCDENHGIPYPLFEMIQYDVYGFERKGDNNRGDAGAICVNYNAPRERLFDVNSVEALISVMEPFQHNLTYAKGSLVIPENLTSFIRIRVGETITLDDLFFLEWYMGRHGRLTIEGVKLSSNTVPFFKMNIHVLGGSVDIEMRNMIMEGRILLRNTLYDSSFKIYRYVEKK